MSGKSHKDLKGPYPMAEMWPALPAVIDTAFEDHLTKKVYFFSGTKLSNLLIFICKKINKFGIFI